VQTCSHAEKRAVMLPGMRGTIARKGCGLPDERSAANPICSRPRSRDRRILIGRCVFRHAILTPKTG
jgi:hypothetical protein